MKTLLSPKQDLIVRMLITGCNRKEIAADLEVSYPAIGVHMQQIRRKTGVADDMSLYTALLHNPGHLRDVVVKRNNDDELVDVVDYADEWNLSGVLPGWRYEYCPQVPGTWFYPRKPSQAASQPLDSPDTVWVRQVDTEPSEDGLPRLRVTYPSGQVQILAYDPGEAQPLFQEPKPSGRYRKPK